VYTTDKNNFPIRLTPIYYDLRINADEENNETSEEMVDVDASKPVNITVSLITANEESLDNKGTRIEKIINLIPKLVKDSVTKLFEYFKDILAMKTDDLKTTKFLPHKIILKPGRKPVKQQAYRLSKIQAQALKKELEKLINNDLIEPSHSPWSSPIVLVLKKIVNIGYAWTTGELTV